MLPDFDTPRGGRSRRLTDSGPSGLRRQHNRNPRPKESAPEGADYEATKMPRRLVLSELVSRADQEEPPHRAVLIQRGVRQLRTAAVGLQINRRL